MKKARWWIFGIGWPASLVGMLDSVHHHIRMMLSVRLPVTSYGGRHVESGALITVLVVGTSELAVQLIENLIENPRRTKVEKGVYLWRLRRFVEEITNNEHTLLISCIDCRIGRILLHRCLEMPEFVNLSINVLTDSELPHGARRRQKDNLRLIRRGNFQWQTGHSRDDFELFYYRMYLPYAIETYGERAQTRKYWRLRIAMRNGGILWILQDGVKLCGSLYMISGGVFYSLAVGTSLRRGDPNFKGVLASTYLFEIQCAKEHHLRVVDLGVCRPLLQDGVLLHKKRWGAVVAPSKRQRNSLFVHWNENAKEIPVFFGSASPIVIKNDRLFGVIGKSDSMRVMQAVKKQLWLPGLTDISSIEDLHDGIE